MKKYIILIGMSALFACNTATEKQTSLADSLENANENMSKELAEKETLLKNKEDAMVEFINSFNEIKGNLREIAEKEKIISETSKGVESNKSDKDQIIGDIQAIYNLLEKNKKKVASLSRRLKDSNLKMDELESAVANLTSDLTTKETEIADLKVRLEKMNVDFASLNLKYTDEKYESDMKTEKLNTAYYVVGTTKDLREKGVITKEGGFIGLGRVAELSDKFNQNHFTKVDITLAKEIPVNGKRVKLVTTHPANSYRMVEEDNAIDKIVITDAEKFWSASKYLIITAERPKSQEETPVTRSNR